MLCCELARIGSHLLWLGTHALDLGAATVFFHTFKDREWHYDLVEDLTGARLTTSFTRVGGVAARRRPASGSSDLREFADELPQRVDEYESLLTKQPIWLQRTQGVGRDQRRATAIAYGMTGPGLRAAGVELRPAQGPAVLRLRELRVRGPDRHARATSTTATSCASRRCASRRAS